MKVPSTTPSLTNVKTDSTTTRMAGQISLTLAALAMSTARPRVAALSQPMNATTVPITTVTEISTHSILIVNPQVTTLRLQIAKMESTTTPTAGSMQTIPIAPQVRNRKSV